MELDVSWAIRIPKKPKELKVIIWSSDIQSKPRHKNVYFTPQEVHDEVNLQRIANNRISKAINELLTKQKEAAQ